LRRGHHRQKWGCAPIAGSPRVVDVDSVASGVGGGSHPLYGQLRHRLTMSRVFFLFSPSAIPPRTCRVICPTWCPCLSDADWCLQSDVMAGMLWPILVCRLCGGLTRARHRARPVALVLPPCGRCPARVPAGGAVPAPQHPIHPQDRLQYSSEASFPTWCH